MKLVVPFALSVLLIASCGKVSVPSTDGSIDELPADAAAADTPDATPCEGTVDSCGVCNGNDLDLDCADTCFGGATVDMCGTCDDEPSNDCIRDCEGNFGGTATVDDCGTCDSDPDNDCWADGITGTLTIAESGFFDFGSGTQTWSINTTQRGFFYARAGETNPDLHVANLLASSLCSNNSPGYTGLAAVTDLTNAADLTYTTDDAVLLFGTRNHPNCNMGLLVFEQGGRFGVIDFLDIDANSNLTIRFWLANAGVTDFSGAPL